MKKFKSCRRAGVALALCASFAAFPSCKKENLADSLPKDFLPGGFHRTLTLEKGDSYLCLELGSDSEESLDLLEKHLSLETTYLLPDPEVSDAFPAVPPSENDWDREKYAVHLRVVESSLGDGVKALDLSLEAHESAKTDLYGVYSGGPYYFYSYDAPHYFRVTPLEGKCVSAWLYEKGSSWQFVSWAGGSCGNYLCRYAWAASSSVSTKDYRLKAIGSKFSVYWY